MESSKDIGTSSGQNVAEEVEQNKVMDAVSEDMAPETDAGIDDQSADDSASAGQEQSKDGVRKLFRKKKGDSKKDGDSSGDSRQIESLNAQLAEVTSKLSETNDKYIRLAAEFDNYRRRTSRERLELISSAGEDVLKGILPTLDDCEKALDMLSKLEGCEAAVEGTRLIYDKLMAYLKGRGIIRIEAVGADFDTDLHEAVAQFPVQEEEKKNKVIDVVRQGYKLKDKVIRYAQVVVGI